MKIAIVGSGAMEQLFGDRLQIAGESAVFFDTQQETLAALTSGGITVRADDSEEHIDVTAVARHGDRAL